MNRQSYIKIIEAVVNLLVVIMVEVGRVSYDNAYKIGTNVLKAITGSTGDREKKKEK